MGITSGNVFAASWATCMKGFSSIYAFNGMLKDARKTPSVKNWIGTIWANIHPFAPMLYLRGLVMNMKLSALQRHPPFR